MANLYEFGSDRFYFRPDRNIDLYNLSAVRNDHLAKGIKFCLVNKSNGETNTDESIKADMAISIKGERALVKGTNEIIQNPETGRAEVWHVIKYTQTSLQHAGAAKAQIIFTQGETTLHSFAFDFLIHEDLLTQGESMTEITFDLSSLKKVIEQVKTVKQEYESASADIAQMRDEEAGRKASERERASAETARKEAEGKRASAETARSEAEENRKQAESTRRQDEASRAQSETERKSAETAREEKESDRQTEEVKRVSAETARREKEEERLSAETTRTDEERRRKEAETKRAEAEKTRAEEEAKRKTAEEQRASKETARQGAETERGQAETARTSAEKARVDAESARATAETGRVEAEKARATAEGRRDTAESARASAEAERESKEQARITAEGKRASAETTRKSAEDERVEQQAQNHQIATEDHAKITAALEVIKRLDSGQLVGDVADLTIKLNTYVSKFDTLMAGDIDKNLDQIHELAEAIKNGGAKLTALTEQLATKATADELKAAREALEKQIGTKASASDLASGLAGKVDTATHTVDLSKKADKATVETMQTEAETHYTDASVTGETLRLIRKSGDETAIPLPKGFSGNYNDLTGAPNFVHATGGKITIAAEQGTVAITIEEV